MGRVSHAYPVAEGFLVGAVVYRHRRLLHGDGDALPLGTPEKMGPAFFPIMVGLLLAGLGAILSGRAFVIDGAPIDASISRARGDDRGGRAVRSRVPLARLVAAIVVLASSAAMPIARRG